LGGGGIQEQLEGRPQGIQTSIRNYDGMNPCSAVEVTPYEGIIKEYNWVSLYQRKSLFIV
jgi:hypothetical protein